MNWINISQELLKISNINSKVYVHGKFQWQEGFGAFSYVHSQIDNVVHYIKNQEMHHKIHNFREEYIHLLEKFNIEYNKKYVFG